MTRLLNYDNSSRYVLIFGLIILIVIGATIYLLFFWTYAFKVFSLIHKTVADCDNICVNHAITSLVEYSREDPNTTWLNEDIFNDCLKNCMIGSKKVTKLRFNAVRSNCFPNSSVLWADDIDIYYKCRELHPILECEKREMSSFLDQPCTVIRQIRKMSTSKPLFWDLLPIGCRSIFKDDVLCPTKK